MPSHNNGLPRFWQELKRRNVIRVISVYVATAFVILEAVDIIFPRFGFPDWTITFVFSLLVIGFIVSVIISWIYDFHPLGGIVKTEPAKRTSKVEVPRFSNSWKIASYISFAVIVGLIVLNIVERPGRTGTGQVLDKSIAVLPFKSLSEDPEKQYQADGVMDAILLNLSRIEDLRVLARTSVEKYRITNKTATEICQELGVGYVLEGSFRTDGDQARLIVQLISSGKEDHVWADQFDREWKDHFAVESEVARSIARELQAVITPEEIKRIEKIPTTSLTADDFYQQGRAEISKFDLRHPDQELLNTAENLFRKALEYDSTFALAYIGLGNIYWNKHYWEESYSGRNWDSILILADKALQYDPQLAEAYVIRGRHYLYINPERAVREFDRAIQYNPNSWQAYVGKMNVYVNEELLLAIQNGIEAVSLKGGGAELPDLLRALGSQFHIAGFPEKASAYYANALKLDGDSAKYYNDMSNIESSLGNFMQMAEYAKKAYAHDSLNQDILIRILEGYQRIGKFEESLVYCNKLVKLMNNLSGTPVIPLPHRIAYSFDKTGDHDSAEFYFQKQIEYSDEAIKSMNGTIVFNNYYDRAGVYAYQGKEEQAMEDLRMFNRMEKIPLWWVSLIKTDPLLDNLRDEPEFQQIVRDMEAKYQAEHERVRQWLEENDML